MLTGKKNSQKPRLSLVGSSITSSVPSTPASENQLEVQNSIAKYLIHSKVIKPDYLNNNSSSGVRIDHFTPSEVVGKRAAVLPAESNPSNNSSRLAVEGLKQNLKTLNDLQARLRFMLSELEDLVQKA